MLLAMGLAWPGLASVGRALMAWMQGIALLMAEDGIHVMLSGTTKYIIQK